MIFTLLVPYELKSSKLDEMRQGKTDTLWLSDFGTKKSLFLLLNTALIAEKPPIIIL